MQYVYALLALSLFAASTRGEETEKQFNVRPGFPEEVTVQLVRILYTIGACISKFVI